MRQARYPRRRGAMLVLIALLLPVVLILAALAMNISYIELSRTEMKVASDAAARAGGREFSLTGDQAQAIVKGKEAGTRNYVGGQPLVLEDTDFVFGEATRVSAANRYNFNAGAPNPNAIQVTGQRTSSSAAGSVPLLLTSILGRDTFELSQSSISTRVEVDIALVVDKSGSMAYADNEPAIYPPAPSSAPAGWNFCDAAPSDSRWLDLVVAVNAFLAELSTSPQDEKVALCTYDGSSTIDVNLTTDHTLIPAAMATYTASFCAGGTNIGGGINQGINAVADAAYERPWAAKVIVVMTDGIHNTGSDPVDAAGDAAEDGIMVFSVTFSDEADQSLMQDVAQEGLGKHFHATSGADLVLVFQEIARSLPTLLTK